MTTVDIDRQDRALVQPAATAARDAHYRRLFVSGLAVFLLSSLALFALWFTQRGQLDLVAEQARTNTHVAQQLTDQLKALGATPVATPVAGPAGATGAQGVPGAAGAKGDAGPQGAQGVPGAPGKDGADGAAGETGPAGAPGKDGADGAPGKDGADGAPGVAGQDGQPPESWAYSDDFGRSYTCRRVADFDPAHPQYTCAMDSTSVTPSAT